MFETDHKETWRGGVYLTTAVSSFEADIFVSKLEAEGIPSVKRYVGASNIIEITMGMNSVHPVDLYVPESALEEAREIIRPVPIGDDFEEAEDAWSEEDGSEE